MAKESVSDMVNRAIDALGIDATGGEVVAWVKATYPSVDINDATVASTLSQQKKKRREAGEQAAPTTPKVKSDLSMDDLLAVREIATKNGGVSKLLEQVKKIEGLALELGGFAKFKTALEGLLLLSNG